MIVKNFSGHIQESPGNIPAQIYVCDNGQVIADIELVCDGVTDCQDFSDEKYCPELATPETTTPETTTATTTMATTTIKTTVPTTTQSKILFKLHDFSKKDCNDFLQVMNFFALMEK